ncbi:MAG: EamA family transporter, partial [Chloroflexota bacterium]|nr:EamA family transporter [Chloroflexota bacterium]
MKREYLGMIIMALAASLLASATVLMKIIPQETRLFPEHVAIWRFSIAAPILWLTTLFRKAPRKKIIDRPLSLIGLGAVYAVASFSALFALARLPSSIYVIIVFIYPSVVVLISLIMGKVVPKLYWLGLPLTFIG